MDGLRETKQPRLVRHDLRSNWAAVWLQSRGNPSFCSLPRRILGLDSKKSLASGTTPSGPHRSSEAAEDHLAEGSSWVDVRLGLSRKVSRRPESAAADLQPQPLTTSSGCAGKAAGAPAQAGSYLQGCLWPFKACGKRKPPPPQSKEPLSQAPGMVGWDRYSP